MQQPKTKGNRFKKISSALIALIAIVSCGLFGSVTTATANDQPIGVTIDGQAVYFTDAQPIILDGRTLVPVYGVFEALGFEVGWDNQTRQVTLIRADYNIVLTIGSSTFINNETADELCVPAQIIGGRTKIPLRAVLESVGYYLDWYAATRTVLISSEAPPFIGIGARLPVLAYHSIMPQQYYYPYNVYNLWILNLDLFYRQMRYLYENNFNTVTSEQLINFLYYDGDLPPNPIVLTFDDGYLDNALFAAPILRQFGFTGMVFMFTVQIPPETPTMTSSPAFMSAELMLANKDVFEFGSHTHGLHHRIDGVAAMQVVDYARIVVDLRRSFEHPLNLLTGFAYPFGQYNDNAIAALQSEGILFAFTTRFAYAYRNTDPFRIPRFLVTSAPQWYDKEFFSDIVHGRRE